MSREVFWQDRPVLVTGCTGILGAWLTQTLVECGAVVTGLIRDWVPNSHLVRSGVIRRINMVRGDVCDAALMDRLFAEYEIDTCFHLAAQTVVGIANRSPVSTLETNIRGTWTVLEAARRWPGTGRVIVASSDKAYGAQADLPYTEDAPLQGMHPYDVSKSCADLIAQAYAHTYGLPVGITRCGNLYGGGDLNWNRIVPGTMRSVLRGERPVIRSDGSMRRDYVYVRDAVDAYLTFAEALVEKDLRGQAFNFGMDAPLRVDELVQKIIAISDSPELTPIVESRELQEIPDQYLSSEKANHVLGWQPRYTLDDGLRETLGWYREFFNAANAAENNAASGRNRVARRRR